MTPTARKAAAPAGDGPAVTPADAETSGAGLTPADTQTGGDALAPTDNATAAGAPDGMETKSADTALPADTGSTAPGGSEMADRFEQEMQERGSGPFAAPLTRPLNALPTLQNIPQEELRPLDAEPMDASSAAPKSTNPDKERLVDEDGNAVSVEDLFDETDTTQSFRFTKVRVYREQPMAGAPGQTTRILLYPQGARVQVAQVASAKQQWGGN